jgi:hypothetical protein
MTELGRIGLQEAVAALRSELIESMKAVQGEQLLFEVGEMTMEFQVEAERSSDAKGGVKFWLVDMGVGSAIKDKDVHKVAVRLKPVAQNGRPIRVGSSEVPE